jgi:hypothetical protein
MNPVLQPGQFDQTMLLSMMDVMRHQGINPQTFFGHMLMNTSQPSLMQNNMLQPMFLSQPQPNGLLHSTQVQQSPNSFEMDPSMVAGSSAPLPKPTASFNSQISPPSSGRRPPTPSTPPPPSRPKGKRRESSRSRTHHRKVSSSPIDTPNSPILSISPPSNVLTPPKPRPAGSPRPPGKIFTSHSGKQLSFFVQVDLSNRLSTVNKIKVRISPIDFSCLLILIIIPAEKWRQD